MVGMKGKTPLKWSVNISMEISHWGILHTKNMTNKTKQPYQKKINLKFQFLFIYLKFH